MVVICARDDSGTLSASTGKVPAPWSPYLVARRQPVLWQRPVACGVAYGLVLYAVMNYVVVPLSAAEGGGSKDPLWIGLSIAVHALLIGLPIALFARRAVRAGSGLAGSRA